MKWPSLSRGGIWPTCTTDSVRAWYGIPPGILLVLGLFLAYLSYSHDEGA